MQTERQKLGQRAEQLAALQLEKRGAIILLRNYRRRLGELDLVARERDDLVIVEVRTRSSCRYGGAAASVNRAKQRRIVRAAQQLLQEYPQLGKLRIRFDVAVVIDPAGEAPCVDWLPHAFQLT